MCQPAPRVVCQSCGTDCGEAILIASATDGHPGWTFPPEATDHTCPDPTPTEEDRNE